MTTFILPEALTIESAASTRLALLEALKQPADVLALDGSEVSDVDGAGIQLLISTLKEATDLGREITLRSSRALRDTLEMLAISRKFPDLSGEPQA